jgi:hypothetical protein
MPAAVIVIVKYNGKKEATSIATPYSKYLALSKGFDKV